MIVTLPIMYLAGPIGRCENANQWARILALQYRASEIEGKLLDLGWSTISPYSSVNCRDNWNRKYEDWMLSSRSRIVASDAICMCFNWQLSPGAMDDYQFAKEQGKKLFTWRWGQLLALGALTMLPEHKE